MSKILLLNGACEGSFVETEQGGTEFQKTLVQPTAQAHVSGRLAACLAPPSLPVIRMNTSYSPPVKWGPATSLISIPTDTKNCLSCWSKVYNPWTDLPCSEEGKHCAQRLAC